MERLEIRLNKSPEHLKEMTAHTGKCVHCAGPVKMPRGKKMELLPEYCWCIQCGQRYFMKIDDINAWEIKQWEQKAARR